MISVVANTLFKEHNKDIIDALLDVQLSANIVARRVSATSTNLPVKLHCTLCTLKLFSIQCDESTDNNRTVQLMMFMTFSSCIEREEFLTLVPLKTTTKAADIV